MTAGSRLGWCAALAGLLAACGSPDNQTGPSFGKAGSGPSVTATAPSAAPQDTTLDVQIAGSGFDAGSSAQFLLGGTADSRVRTNSTRYVSPTSLVANVTIAADAVTASYDVAVTTGSGKKGIGSDLFTVTLRAEPLGGSADGSIVMGMSHRNGYVAGSVAGSCSSSFSPAIWNQAGALIRLPEISGACGGNVFGVNSSGVAVGLVLTATRSYDIRWVSDGSGYTAEVLPDQASGTKAGAWTITDDGTIVGYNDAAILAPGASSWQMLARPSGATACNASSMNNGGLIGGECTVSGIRRAVLWSSSTAAPLLLPVVSGGTGQAFVRSVNDQGVVVGWADVQSRHTTTTRAVRWTGAGGGWTVSFLPDLGSGSVALAVNDANVIVGYVTGSGNQHSAVIWGTPASFRVLEGSQGAAEGIADDQPLVSGKIEIGGQKVAVVWRP